MVTTFSQHLSPDTLNEGGLSEEEARIFGGLIFTFKKVLTPGVVVLGIVGNILAFAVLRMPQYGKQTSCFYLRTLAVFDSSCILGHMTIRILSNYRPHMMFNPQTGTFICPLICMALGTYGLSNWTIALMTIDRSVAVMAPLKVAAWSTQKRARTSMIGIFCLFLAVSVPFSLGTVADLHNTVIKYICGYDRRIFPPWYHNMIYLVHSVALFTTPFFIILVFNILIVATLMKQRFNKQTDLGRTKTAPKDGHITVLLMLVSLIFLITNIPWTIDQWLWGYILQSNVPTLRMSTIRRVSYEFSVFVIFVNPSINFYVYCMGCRKFREDVKSIFKKNVTSGGRSSHKSTSGMKR